MKIQPSFQKERAHLKDVLPLSTPYLLHIDVSEVCNLKCNYCFRSKGYTDYGFALRNDLMSTETFYNAVDQIAEFPEKIKKISLSGHGEPLCNRRLPEMIAYLKDKIDTYVEIHTNAVLLDESYAIELIESGIDKIVISLQGLTSDKYKDVCGSTIDLERFLQCIKILYQKSVHTEIYIKIVDVALETEMEYQFFEMVEGICHKAYIETAIDLWTDPKSPKKISAIKNKFGEIIPYQESCSTSFYTLFIAPNGEIYPCINPLSPVCFGNVNKTSLIKIWNSESRNNFLKKQLKEGRDYIPVCRNCVITQNTIMSKDQDSLNGYREKVLKKMI